MEPVCFEYSPTSFMYFEIKEAVRMGLGYYCYFIGTKLNKPLGTVIPILNDADSVRNGLVQPILFAPLLV